MLIETREEVILVEVRNIIQKNNLTDEILLFKVVVIREEASLLLLMFPNS